MTMLKGWRTRIFSIAVGVLAVLDYLDPSLIADMAGPHNRPVILLIVAVLIFLLRQMTSTPPGESA